MMKSFFNVESSIQLHLGAIVLAHLCALSRREQKQSSSRLDKGVGVPTLLHLSVSLSNCTNNTDLVSKGL